MTFFYCYSFVNSYFSFFDPDNSLNKVKSDNMKKERKNEYIKLLVQGNVKKEYVKMASDVNYVSNVKIDQSNILRAYIHCLLSEFEKNPSETSKKIIKSVEQYGEKK